VFYRSQCITAYRKSMQGDVFCGALWCGVCVLEDGAWLELIEGSGEK